MIILTDDNYDVKTLRMFIDVSTNSFKLHVARWEHFLLTWNVFLETAGQVGGEEQIASLIGELSDIDGNANAISQSADHLSISFYALIAWVGIATVALIAVTVVTLQRRRRRLREVAADDGVDSTASSFDFEGESDELPFPSTVAFKDSVATERECPLVADAPSACKPFNAPPISPTDWVTEVDWTMTKSWSKVVQVFRDSSNTSMFLLRLQIYWLSMLLAACTNFTVRFFQTEFISHSTDWRTDKVSNLTEA